MPGKLFVALLAIRAITVEVGGSGPAFETASQLRTMIAFGVFTLPLLGTGKVDLREVKRIAAEAFAESG